MTPDQAAALARQAWDRGEAAMRAGDAANAARWLDRAHRLAPADPTIKFALASACLARDPVRARTLFAALAAQHDVREIHLGLAAACDRLDDSAAARTALAAALTRHAQPPDDGWIALANRIAPNAWRAVDTTLKPVVPAKTGAQPHSLRNPIARPDLPAVRRVEGLATIQDNTITGWAWHPANPTRPVTLTIRPAIGRTIRVRADQAVDTSPISTPLARPLGFRARINPAHGPFHIHGDDNRPLPGSPIHPGALTRIRHAAPPPGVTPAPRPLAIVVPVHGNRAATLACLASVIATRPRGARIIVVDDASPDPTLAADLDHLAARRRIHLIRLPENQGFPAAANAGIAAAAQLRNKRGRDILLLNSDTIAPPDAIARLHAQAYRTARTATVCPLSNNATLLSYPHPATPSPMPDAGATARLATLAWRANGARRVRIPTPVGFCMLIRHDAWNAAGPFRADLFGRGYGEENHFAECLHEAGWHHHAAPGVFVAHQGEASFGPLATALRAQAQAVLSTLHPTYLPRIAAFNQADPLAPHRRRLDLARFRDGRARQSVLLLTHVHAGGVERAVQARAAAAHAAGLRPIILRPAPGNAVRIGDETHPNLTFQIPGDYPALLRTLRAERPRHMEIHHFLGYAPHALRVSRDLGIPHSITIHDHAWICPRLTLTRPDGSYCGEPDLAACETCRVTHGTHLDPALTVAALRQRSAALLRTATETRIASTDTATRLRRYFPKLRPAVAPLEPDASFPPLAPARPTPRHILLAGAIGPEKGFPLLLAAAQDAAARNLPLRFTLVGHSIDDAALLATGTIFITGPYQPHEAVDLIHAQDADLALFPSTCPETWSHVLTELWQAGLPVAAFDIGAQAERIRATGRGIILPLGLPAPALNNALLAARW